jgi:circadian clock protein KaiB
MTAALFRLRLYITGGAPNSVKAITNLEELCRRYLPDRHHIEVVDLAREPRRALSDRIFITPTLVKLAPGQEQRFVGSLNDLTPILALLGIDGS